MPACTLQTNRGHLPPPPAWATALAEAVTDVGELCRLLGLPPKWRTRPGNPPGSSPSWFPGPGWDASPRATPAIRSSCRSSPKPRNLSNVPQFQTDPLGEAEAAGCSGLLWKYPGRLLVVTTGACAVHCRFCFRRHFPYMESTAGVAPWEAALRVAAAEPSLEEIILSGGDPLALPDSELSQLARRLAAIPHLRRLRIHSRLPIVIPQRVTDELLAWLRGSRLTPVLVVQVNHAAEIDAAVAVALGRLVDAGVPVLAQSVLLRGVNDDLEVLAALYRRLVDLRVMPYYLHQLDRVAGAAHFEVSPQRGRELIGQLRGGLPGYAVPRYVCETPGRASKTVLG